LIKNSSPHHSEKERKNKYKHLKKGFSINQDMGFLKYFSDWKKLQSKLSRSFNKFKKELDLKISKEDVREIIKEELREELRGATTQSTTRSDLGSMQKRVLKKLDSLKLMKAIQGYVDDGYSTCQIRDEILNRFDIGTTCFYKYLKKVKQEIFPKIRT